MCMSSAVCSLPPRCLSQKSNLSKKAARTNQIVCSSGLRTTSDDRRASAPIQSGHRKAPVKNERLSSHTRWTLGFVLCSFSRSRFSSTIVKWKTPLMIPTIISSNYYVSERRMSARQRFCINTFTILLRISVPRSVSISSRNI